MKNCPVCSTQYIEGEVICQICSWDLSPYPLTFVIPEAYISQEQTKLNWARAIWSKQQEFPALSAEQIAQLEEEKTRLEKVIHQKELEFVQERSQLQSQIESLNHEKIDLSTQLKQLAQEQLLTETINREKIRLEQERSHLQSQVAQLTQDSHQILQRINTYEQERSHLKTTLESLKKQQNHLQEQIKKLEKEKLELQHQANYAFELKAELSQVQARLNTDQKERAHLQRQLQQVQTERQKLYDELERLRKKISVSKTEKDIWDL